MLVTRPYPQVVVIVVVAAVVVVAAAAAVACARGRRATQDKGLWGQDLELGTTLMLNVLHSDGKSISLVNSRKNVWSLHAQGHEAPFLFDEDTEYRSIFETPLFPPAFYSSHNFGERYLRLFVSPGISKPNPRKPDPTYLGGDLSSRSSRLAEVVSFLSVCCSHAASQPARLGCCNKEEEKFGWLVGSLTQSVSQDLPGWEEEEEKKI